MRIFMEHQTDVLPVVERGRIIGQIDRAQLIEALSEIRPEGCSLTIKPPDSTDTLLKRLDDSKSDTLATINRNYEFNALLTRAEIIQGGGRTPQVKVWTPPLEPDPVNSVFHATEGTTESIPENTASFSIVRNSVQINISAPQKENSITIEKTPEEPSGTTPQDEIPRIPEKNIASNIHRDIERGRLAINTLAALDLPLMACDGNGAEIFHNRAFAQIRLRDGLYLKTTELMHSAKDAITESALKGNLDIENAIQLKSSPRAYNILCKAIRNYEDPNARAQGYIFWLVPKDAKNSPVQSGENFSLDSNALPNTEFSGRTLPEILAAEEARAMAWAMREANDNQSDAALLLGIPRQTFNYRYRKLMRMQNKSKNKEQ
ncbi:MAG: hypothetical protein LDLANPLL_02729 [Turneriella sp.]|nr:hypothetical protein [Turneriella sp.]